MTAQKRPVTVCFQESLRRKGSYLQKRTNFFYKVLAELKNSCIFALALKAKAIDGPFVYRLGRQVFILVRGVRFPYGLQSFNF